MSGATTEATDVLVIFGITGDLAHQMTFRAQYRLEAAGRLSCPIIGVALDDWSEDYLVAAMRDAVEAHKAVEEKVFDRLARRLSHLQGDFADPGTYERPADGLRGSSRPLSYLEVPPTLFAPVVMALAQAGLSECGRVMIEKPFGHDLTSARALNDQLHQVLAELAKRDRRALRIHLGTDVTAGLEQLRAAVTEALQSASDQKITPLERR